MSGLRLLLLTGWLLSLGTNCLAQSARLQSESIYLGDIATLLIEYEHKIPSLYALDTTQLEENFEILDVRSRTSRLSDSEQFTNRMQWEVRMLPRRSGLLIIPSMKLGALRTPELQLEVLPLSSGAAARQTVEIEIFAEPVSPLVGQQTNVTLRLVFNTPLLDVYWSEPMVEGANIMRGIAESSYSLRRDGEYYDVIERVMAVFPEVQGVLEFSPAGLRASVDALRSEDGIASPGEQRQLFRNSASLRLDVRDIPAGYTGRYWLPARELELTQRWESETDDIRVGDSIGHTITIVARGLPGKALPVDLLSGRNAAYGVYADQAVQEHWIEGRDLVGRLEQTFAIIMTHPGIVTLPEVNLKWWDVDAAVERVAVLPARSIRVLPASAGGDSEVVDILTWLRYDLVEEVAVNPVWLLAPILFTGLLWFAWRVRDGVLRNWLSAGLRRVRARQRLRRACRLGYPRQARTALLEWAALRWPEAGIRGLAQVGKRFDSAAFDTELSRLDRALFAPAAASWDGAGLWHELRAAEAVARNGRTVAPQRLRGLYPPAQN